MQKIRRTEKYFRVRNFFMFMSKVSLLREKKLERKKPMRERIEASLKIIQPRNNNKNNNNNINIHQSRKNTQKKNCFNLFTVEGVTQDFFSFHSKKSFHLVQVKVN